MIDVDVRCARIGRTSAAIAFDVRAGGRECCAVETTYVYADPEGAPQPIPDEIRAQLT